MQNLQVRGEHALDACFEYRSSSIGLGFEGEADTIRRSTVLHLVVEAGVRRDDTHSVTRIRLHAVNTELDQKVAAVLAKLKGAPPCMLREVLRMYPGGRLSIVQGSR